MYDSGSPLPPRVYKGGKRLTKKKKKKKKKEKKEKQLHVACQIRMVTKSDSEITEGNTENGGTETQSKFSGKGKTKRADTLVPRRKTTVMAPAG